MTSLIGGQYDGQLCKFSFTTERTFTGKLKEYGPYGTSSLHCGHKVTTILLSDNIDFKDFVAENIELTSDDTIVGFQGYFSLIEWK